MARRGTFGRVPRAAPNLTATIIALAREMQAQRDSNIKDAWESGGDFEGKPVTDEMYLGHWQERLSGVEKDDPLYDTYKNTVDQLDYHIHESKAYTAYTQGKLSSQGLASFYLNWAKKVPRDSEFYRTIQQQAARFLEEQKARDKAAAAEAKQKAYEAAQEAYATGQAGLSKGTRVADLLNWALSGVASVNSLAGSDGLAGVSDPSHLMALVEAINEDPGAAIFLVNGKKYTGQDLFNDIKKLDPAFKMPVTKGGEYLAQFGAQSPTVTSGGLTQDWMLGVQEGAHATLIKQADMAEKAGKKDEAKAFTKGADQISGVISGIGVWGVDPVYDSIIAARDRVLRNPGATVDDRIAASSIAATKLETLSKNKNLDMREALTLHNEALANNGDMAQGSAPTLGESVRGKVDPAGSNAGTATLVANLTAERDAIAKDPDSYTWVYGTRDKETGAFTFDPQGRELGVVSKAIVARTITDFGTVSVEQVTGEPILVTIAMHPIDTVAYDSLGNPLPQGVEDPETGLIVKTGKGVVGAIGTYWSLGKEVQIRRINNSDQVVVGFTTGNPWGNGVSEVIHPDGSATLDVTSYVSVNPTTGFSTGTQTEPFQYVDAVTASISPTLDHAGKAINQVFNTMLGASAAAADNPAEVYGWMGKDPDAAAAWVEQEVNAAGDPNDPAYATNLAGIQNEDTLVAGSAINQGDRDKPIWSFNSAGNVVSRANASVGHRPLADDNSWNTLMESMIPRLVRGTPAEYLGGSRYSPGGGKQIKAATPDMLRLPGLPAGFGGHTGGIAPTMVAAPQPFGGHAGGITATTPAAPAPVSPLFYPMSGAPPPIPTFNPFISPPQRPPPTPVPVLPISKSRALSRAI